MHLAKEDWKPPTRNGAAMSANEYCMALNVIHFLMKYKTILAQVIDLEPRDLVAEVCGVGKNTAQKALSMYKNKRIPEDSLAIGRPKLELENDYVANVREIILENNKEGNSLTSEVIATELFKKHSHMVKPRTLRNHMHQMGLYFGVGTRKNSLHDAPNVVKYRHEYVTKRLENLTTGMTYYPKAPEVFLDESYCHIGHSSRLTWLPHCGTVTEEGRKQLMVIFGAFIVYRQGNRLCAEIIKGGNGIIIWPVTGGPRQSDQPRRGRPFQDAEEWKSLPECVKEADITPDLHDYHGNFTADLFESIFEDLCKHLSQEYPGGCHIHMDGAKYHMRIKNSVPKSSWTVNEVKDWYQQQHIDIPNLPNCGRPPTKQQLVEYAMSHYADREMHTTYEIAHKYGHKIMKTPPYHCELQPIEKLWGSVKEQIRRRDSGDKDTALSLRNTLLELFSKTDNKTLVSIWRKSVEANRSYDELRKSSFDVDVDLHELESSEFQ